MRAESDFPFELAEAIRSVANERRLTVARDTHYDADNMVLQWWSSGRELHRLDFQPMPEGHVLVTSMRDIYPFLGRILRWAWSTIPLFPYAAKTHQRSLGTLEPPFSTDMLRSKVSGFLGRAE